MAGFPVPAKNRAELIERIRDAHDDMVAMLAPLTVEQVLAPIGDWSIRDHLAHLAAWSGKALALLQDEPGYRGLGLTSPPADPRDYDSINAQLHSRDISLTLEEVVERWGARDAEVQAALMLARDSDLRRHTPPDEPGGPTVLAAVAGNTYEHCIEHLAWIREGLMKARRR